MNFLPSTNKLRYDVADGDSPIARYRRHHQAKRRRRSTSLARATIETDSHSDWTDAESRDPGNAGSAARARRDSQPVDESADDEDDDASSAFETAEGPARESGWKRADRIVSGSLAGEAATRSELLMRERSISEEALRSSLSTLLMLRPGNIVPPVLAKSDMDSTPSLSSSPASNVTARGKPTLDRRSTIMHLSYDAGTSARVPTPISRDESGWANAQISSASSFEDLGLEFDSEQDHVRSTVQQNKLLYNKPEVIGKRRRAIKKGLVRRQAAGLMGSPSKSGFVSEPDTSQARPDADFLELLLAARTFASMRSSQTQSLDMLTDQVKPPQSSTSSRDASPAGPASMSSSTNFVLSSSDSPPSRDLASSREMARSGSNTRSPSPLPLEMEARLRLSREETITGTPNREPDKPQSWWDWLFGAIGPFGIGITIAGLVGLSFAIASRSNLFRKPMLRSNVVYAM